MCWFGEKQSGRRVARAAYKYKVVEPTRMGIYNCWDVLASLVYNFNNIQQLRLVKENTIYLLYNEGFITNV